MRELPGAQQGDQWHAHKTGRITASEFNKLTAYSKTGLKKNPPVYEELQPRHDLRYRLMIERQTGRRQKNAYVNTAMEWGIEQEPNAKLMFESAMQKMIVPVGFVLHPTINCSGASPDGIVDDAVFEVKCPESKTFEEWWDQEGVPEEHQLQMQWQMACCELKRGIFMAYDPRLAEGHRCFFRDIKRDDAKIAWLESEVLKLDAEIEEMLRKRGLPPTEWVIEDGELALPSKHAPETKLNRQLRESMEALDVLDDDWEKIIERRAHAQA